MHGLHEHAEAKLLTPEVLKLEPVPISDKGSTFASHLRVKRNRKQDHFLSLLKHRTIVDHT